MAEEDLDDAEEVSSEEEGEEEGSGGGGGKKKLIIIIVAVIVLLGGGGSAFLMLGGDGHEEEKKPVVVLPPAYYEIPQMLVDLKTKRGRSRFLKLGVTLEVVSAEAALEVKNYVPKIIDGMQTYLREQNPQSLSGSEGTEKMRAHFLQLSNKELGGKVKSVLFREILLQ